MTPDRAVEMVREALILALLISAPLLIAGLVVGLIVSVVQAVTQLQEQTLTFVPKIVAMIAAAVIVMPWILGHLIDYARQMFTAGM